MKANFLKGKNKKYFYVGVGIVVLLGLFSYSRKGSNQTDSGELGNYDGIDAVLENQDQANNNILSALTQIQQGNLINSNNMADYHSQEETILKSIQTKISNTQKAVIPSKPSTKKTSFGNTGYKGGSVVDYLKSAKVDSSFSNRQKLSGLGNKYKGTASQNKALLKKLRGY